MTAPVAALRERMALGCQCPPAQGPLCNYCHNLPDDAAMLLRRLDRAEAVVQAVEADWFTWDDSGDSKPIGYCKHCSAMHHARMWETTQEFVKSQIESQHEPACPITLIRAYRAEGEEA